MNTAQYLTP